MFGAPDWALDDEIVTMRPQPAASMSGTAAWTQVNVPVRLTAMIRSHFSGVMSAQRIEGLDARAGDEDLDGPELGADLRERGVDRLPVGDVDLDRHGLGVLSLELRGCLVCGLAVSVEDRNVVAVGNELAGDTEPDPGGSAGDDGDPAHRPPSIGSNSRCRSVRPRSTQVGS